MVIRSRSNPKGHRRKLGSDNRPLNAFSRFETRSRSIGSERSEEAEDF